MSVRHVNRVRTHRTPKPWVSPNKKGRRSREDRRAAHQAAQIILTAKDGRDYVRRIAMGPEAV